MTRTAVLTPAARPAWQAQHAEVVGTITVRPIIRDQAVDFVAEHHRHNNRRLPGWKFGCGLFAGQQLVGVGIAGRCSSRVLDKRGDGHWLEVTRVCTTGVENGCSRLYGRNGNAVTAAVMTWLVGRVAQALEAA